MIEKVKLFLQKLRFKINDDQFYNALKISVSAIIIFAFFYNVDQFTLALGMILGLSLSAQIDISSNLKDKIFGLAIASITVPVVTLLLIFASSIPVLFYTVFAILVFISALISMYGQRATQFSFVLLLGISLVFLDISNTDKSLTNSINMLYGGLLYLVVSVVFFLIRPSKYIDLELANSIDAIAQYLKLRSQLWTDHPNIDDIEEKQLTLQVQINNSFKKITQYLEVNKNRIINSKHNRKVILASSFINEIMELALSSTFKTKDINQYIQQQPQLRSSIELITSHFAINLQALSNSINLRTKYQPPNDLFADYETVQNQINLIKNLPNETQTYLENILEYLDTQRKKINGLERVFTENVSSSDLSVNADDLQKYFSPHQYRFKTLIENFSIKSIYLRYALRLTFAMILGLFIGHYNGFKQEYWILSTIVLIMQPGYGLTKFRMYQRIIGTIVGAFLAIVLLYFIPKSFTLAACTVVAMLLSTWFSNTDYKTGVVFNTLYMVLLYGILRTGVEINVIYRISDTLASAFIAFLATNYLWPTWEFLSIKKNVEDAINSIKTYINAFERLYVQKASDDLSLQDARQSAFITIGNLMASYQRLIQEPKSKQQNRAELYQMAVLNQSLTGAIASLGEFIRAHQDNDNFKSFGKILNTIIYNLDLALHLFSTVYPQPSKLNITSNVEIAKLHIALSKKIKLLSDSDTEEKDELKQAVLALSQLNWMVNLSEQITKTAHVIK